MGEFRRLYGFIINELVLIFSWTHTFDDADHFFVDIPPNTD